MPIGCPTRSSSTCASIASGSSSRSRSTFLEAVNVTYSQAVFGLTYPREGSITRYDQPQLNGFRWVLLSIGVRGRF